jgi:hypothetical protein
MSKLLFYNASPARAKNEGTRKVWLLAYSFQRQVKLHMQVLQIQADQIAHLDFLKVSPHPLNRIEVGGVERHPFDVDISGSSRAQELRHRRTPLDGRATPDDQRPLFGHTQKMAQESHRVETVGRFLTHQRIDFTRRRYGPHHGQMVVRLPLPERLGFDYTEPRTVQPTPMKKQVTVAILSPVAPFPGVAVIF